MLLQWHLTERCNCRCQHCYQEDAPASELAPSELFSVLEQYKYLLERVGQPGRITLTGGEPLLREDLFSLIHQIKPHYPWALLTNGTLVDKAIARNLKRLAPTFVQISLDGGPETHDAIRGPGSFDAAIAGIQALVSARIHVSLSFTAHRGNYREFLEVAQIARKLKVKRLWTDRLIPAGNATREGVLSPNETREYLSLLAKAQASWSGVSSERALQFLTCGGTPYRCTAGDSLLALQPNGDLYPCRRLPLKVGNILNIPLIELYETPMLQKLRSSSASGCQSCHWSRWCQGGLRCLSYAMTGDPFHRDPGCWLSDAEG